MKEFGTLKFNHAGGMQEHLAPVTAETLVKLNLGKEVFAAPIDANLSDTAAFCEAYSIPMAAAANCVIVEAKRGDSTWHAACIILATDRIDINGVVRKYLGAKKASFASMDRATALSKMEYGGITPIGLPEEWPILVDTAVLKEDYVIIGSGVRGSKLLIPGALLAKLPSATSLAIAKVA